ncbi:hypothetical protein BOX15_Mlig020528g3, partial [Macrostomum lignano]
KKNCINLNATMSDTKPQDETSIHPHSDWLNLRQLLLAMQNAASEVFPDSTTSSTATETATATAEAAVQSQLLSELTREFPDVDVTALASECNPDAVRRDLLDAAAEADDASNHAALTGLCSFLSPNSLRNPRHQISTLATLRRLRQNSEPLSKAASGFLNNRDRLPAIELLCAHDRASLPVKQFAKPLSPSEMDDLLVTVRVYVPLPDVGGRGVARSFANYLRCSQLILLRARHTLADLKDQICCRQDDVIVGDVSELLSSDNPRQAMSERCSRSRDVYTSSMFHIGLGLYDDCRLPFNRRLSATVLKWLSENSKARQEFGESLTAHTMESTRISSLTLRLGELYLYQHAANCEHIIVFSDVSLKHPATDPEHLPLARFSHGFSSLTFAYRDCQLCRSARAELLISDCDELFDETMCACVDCCRVALLSADGSKRLPFCAFCI